MTRARDMANLGSQAGSGLDASDITTGVLPFGVTGGSGLTHLASNPTVTLGSNATFPAGHVIQVLTATNSTEANTTSESFVAMSLGLNITPNSTSSRFFIICNTSGYNNGGGNHVGYWTIYRDSTNLGPANGYGNMYQGSGANEHLGTNICISELDSPTIPSTPIAITYGMYVRSNSDSYNTYWSMNQSRSDITVMEIA